MSFVMGSETEWICTKHGTFAKREEDWESQTPFPECPRCQYVREQDLCRECEAHKGSVEFAQGILDWSHGMTERICRCCYFNRVSKALEETKENYEKLKAELEANPCQS